MNRTGKAGRDDILDQVLNAAASAAHEIPSSELFYRQLCLNLAREATSSFNRVPEGRTTDGAVAVASFLKHEEARNRLKSGEITSKGHGFHVDADVHQCPYQGVCKKNLHALGEVPHCIRAVTLIEAINAKVPDRPPMSYDLDPGLVDDTSDACHIHLRPAGQPAAGILKTM